MKPRRKGDRSQREEERPRVRGPRISRATAEEIRDVARALGREQGALLEEAWEAWRGRALTRT